jgi:Cu2+-exporting ATPase
MDSTVKTTVLEAGGLHWATSAAVVENVLARRPGVLGVQANAVAQTSTVRYDSARTSVAQLSGWIRDCGYHCAGQSLPGTVVARPSL